MLFTSLNPIKVYLLEMLGDYLHVHVLVPLEIFYESKRRLNDFLLSFHGY